MTLDAGAIGGLKGGLYFQGWVQDTEAANFTLNINGGRFGILPTDPVYGTAVYSELQSFATFAKQLQDAQTFTCPADKPLLAPVFPPAPNCPAGYEGPNCADINECVRGTDDCSVNAACINTPGSFTCQCFLGYTGNGKVCIADVPAQQAIADKFKTDGTVITSSFNPVVYPSTAPGWVYDPTDTSQPSQSRVPVDLLGCQLACETAGETVCTSFQYNEISKRCELRSGECPFQQQPTTDAFCTNPKFLPDVPTQQGTQQDLCGRVVSYYRKVYTLPPGCNPIP